MREAVGTKAATSCSARMASSRPPGAIRLARRLEPYDPLWFEEPMPPEMPEEMAKVARAHDHPDRDRRAADHQIRVRARARRPAPPRSCRWRSAASAASWRQEDRRHGGGPLCPDRAAPLLRARRGRRQHPARGLQPELPDPREHRALGRLPRGDPQGADPLGGRLRDPADRARAWASSSTRRSRLAHPYDGRGASPRNAERPLD